MANYSVCVCVCVRVGVCVIASYHNNLHVYVYAYLCRICLLYISSCRSYNVNGKRDEMKVQFADHEHTEAMTT